MIVIQPSGRFGFLSTIKVRGSDHYGENDTFTQMTMTSENDTRFRVACHYAVLKFENG